MFVGLTLLHSSTKPLERVGSVGIPKMGQSPSQGAGLEDSEVRIWRGGVGVGWGGAAQRERLLPSWTGLIHYDSTSMTPLDLGKEGEKKLHNAGSFGE